MSWPETVHLMCQGCGDVIEFRTVPGDFMRLFRVCQDHALDEHPPHLIPGLTFTKLDMLPPGEVMIRS